MFIPKNYRSEDFSLLQQIISNNAFGLLISSKEQLLATHAMFMMHGDAENFLLESHISRANPQAKLLKDGDEVLCDFLGAHTYISSSWYEKTNVSTWNYQAVQIRGRIKLMNDDELYQHLDRLTNKYETSQKCPMLVKNMGDDFVRKEMKGAFGIFIIPDKIYIANKLSQNRNDQDYNNIIKELQQSNDAKAKEIANQMTLNKKS
ncbi:FMN-binding negative transcriptional regulator [Soonwooa sp.]|uniref:FMN-binding negative transcriptional regulator n=1 Tax=Soonwooa sp. TaxID=1938592 RepID=UPI00261D7F8B|nr:FMN-binding negative transcriptional regulator [Soonwooa sp.]